LAEITWTRESELWLNDIFDYIAVDDPGAAARTVIAIVETLIMPFTSSLSFENLPVPMPTFPFSKIVSLPPAPATASIRKSPLGPNEATVPRLHSHSAVRVLESLSESWTKLDFVDEQKLITIQSLGHLEEEPVIGSLAQ